MERWQVTFTLLIDCVVVCTINVGKNHQVSLLGGEDQPGLLTLPASAVRVNKDSDMDSITVLACCNMKKAGATIPKERSHQSVGRGRVPALQRRTHYCSGHHAETSWFP